MPEFKSKKRCEKCGGELYIEHTKEFEPEKPYEVVCYGCGWFAFERFATVLEAIKHERP